MIVVEKAWQLSGKPGGTIRKLVDHTAIHPQEAQRETGSRARL